MSKSRSWPAEDREDYEDACQRAWDSGETTRERGDALHEEIEVAASANKLWARDLLRQFGATGAQEEIKNWSKARERLFVAHDGRVLNRPRIVGVQRKNGTGAVVIVQALFDVVTFTEIRRKVREWEGQIGAYRDNITAAKRLLALEVRVPGSTAPAEAVKRLGITLDEWLGDEAAS